MTSTPYGTPTRDAASSPAPRRATLAQDAVTVAIGLWLIGGLFSDGWAHHNVPELEGFFTPWHGVLYFGLLLAGAWFIWLGRAGGRRWYRHLPAGYGWGWVGLGVFGLGGLADMAWHLVLGVEAGVDALLSPSHLVLFTGGLLILTSALRSRWGPGGRHLSGRDRRPGARHGAGVLLPPLCLRVHGQRPDRRVPCATRRTPPAHRVRTPCHRRAGGASSLPPRSSSCR